MPPKTFTDYAKDFTQKDLELSLRHMRDPKVPIPRRAQKSDVINAALKWDAENPDKAAAAYDAALAKYPAKARRRNDDAAVQPQQTAAAALPEDLKTAVQEKLREWFALWKGREPGIENDPEPGHAVERELEELERRAEGINRAELDEIIRVEEERDGWEEEE